MGYAGRAQDIKFVFICFCLVYKRFHSLWSQQCLYGFCISVAFLERSLELYSPDFFLVILIFTFKYLINVQ